MSPMITSQIYSEKGSLLSIALWVWLHVMKATIYPEERCFPFQVFKGQKRLDGVSSDQ
jgi:hypothetical protein